MIRPVTGEGDCPDNQSDARHRAARLTVVGITDYQTLKFFGQVLDPEAKIAAKGTEAGRKLAADFWANN